ncbi:glycosyltransferase family 2 protein [Bacillus wiedmannii]|uniref:glycosyltransferase family 2 protein n=1 Tax=Bacillus wiedmannii TaxID=1890302 RepID=UPI0015CF785E|nr:glycosyltransferase family 2 protein [Bacillus wiedmannii]
MTEPLVSILIPATGNSTYLELALTSALLQTYTNIEIIIRDSSPTDEIQLMLEKDFIPYLPRIKYIKNFQYATKSQILQQMIGHANGVYINFLLEKDLFYPTKIEKMIGYFISDVGESIKLVTSCSEKIDVRGNLIDNPLDKEPIHQNDVQLDGFLSGGLILKNKDYIGGLSAPLFRKKDLIQPFGYFATHLFKKELELASWLTLLSQGSLVSITDQLIFERSGTTSVTEIIDIPLIADWIQFIILGQQYGFLHSETAKTKVVNRVLLWIDVLLFNKQYIFTLEERHEILGYKNFLNELKMNL